MAADVGAETRRSPQFEADLVELRRAVRRLQDSMTSPAAYLHVRLMPRLFGFSYQEAGTARQAVLVGLLSAALHLAAPLVVTTLTWSWAGAPVWTWLGVALLLGAFELFGTRIAGESSTAIKGLLELPAAIDDDADLHELVDFTRRIWRRRVFAPPALLLALSVTGMSAIAQPQAWHTVHIGTVVMGALLIHEYLEAQLSASLVTPVYAKESRFLHRLSWLDPLSSPSVQAMLHTWFAHVGAGSPMLVLYGLALAILLVPASPALLVVPLGASALVGLVLILTSLVGLRRSVRRIVQHTKDLTLQSLRERIERLEPRARELTADESEQLRALLETYAAVRDAPTGPSGLQTLGHAVTALAVPALTFFLAVMSEVYAERLLDQFLP